MFIYVLYNGQLKGLNIDKIFAKKALLIYFPAFLYVSKPKTIKTNYTRGDKVRIAKFRVHINRNLKK